MRCKHWLVTVVLLYAGTTFGQKRDSIPLYFANNSAVIDSAAARTMHNEQIAYGRRKILSITGYCDEAGSLPYNDSLSLQRASAVAAWLHAHGLADSLLPAVQGYGKRRT